MTDKKPKHAERDASIIALSGEKTDREIAEMFGLTRPRIAQIISDSQVDKRTRKFISFAVMDIPLAKFQAEADRRRITIDVLARRIIHAVAEENLFKAVLDD